MTPQPTSHSTNFHEVNVMNILWHNPRCSKSRAAHTALSEAGVSFETKLYLQSSPSEDELRRVLVKLEDWREGARPKELREAGFEKSPQDLDAMVKMLMDAPRALQRPIFETERNAAIGRPLENIMALVK